MLKNLFRLEYNNNNLKNIYKLDMPSQVIGKQKKSKTGTNSSAKPDGSRKTIKKNHTSSAKKKPAIALNLSRKPENSNLQIFFGNLNTSTNNDELLAKKHSNGETVWDNQVEVKAPESKAKAPVVVPKAKAAEVAK